MGLQSYVKAKESFERAVELNPLDEEAKSMLEFATSALGKGDVQVNRTEIEPVPVPDALWQKVEAVQDSKSHEGESHIKYALLSLQHEEGEVSKSTRHMKIAIADDNAINAYSTLAFSYDPFGQEIYINYIKVWDEEGNLVSSENRDDFYAMHNEQSGIVSQDRVLHAPIQGLSKGHTLEYMVTFNSLGLVEEIPFSKEYLSYIDPALIGGISFTGDMDKLKYRTLNGVQSLKGDNSVSWYLEDIKPFKQESHPADIDSYIPHIAIGNDEDDWEALVQEYLEEIEEHLTQYDEVKELAASLVEGLESDDEKTRAIYNYIQTEFTYKALLFGPRAKIPNQAPQIIENKYGDCKDLSLLTNRLLDAVGISSRLALVHTGQYLIEELPSLDQFDHMILYLPDYEGGRFVDCTSRHASLSLVAPIGLGDREMLVIDPEKPRIIKSGQHQVGANVINSDKTIKVVDRDLSVVETLELKGVPATYFRYYLGSLTSEDLLSSFQSLITSTTGSDAQIQDVSHSLNPDSNNPLTVTLHYLIPGSVRSGSGELKISEMPHIWERYYLNVPFVKDRVTPFTIEYPFRMSSTVSLELPATASVEEKDLEKVEFENEFHRFSFESSLAEGAKHYRQAVQVDLGEKHFSASLFQDFQKSSQKALSLISSAPRIMQVATN